MKAYLPGKNHPWVILLIIICLIFSGAVVVQAKTPDSKHPDTNKMSRAQLVARYMKSQQQVNTLRRQVATLRVLAGSTPVKGHGIYITLDDTGNSKKKSDPNSNLRVVHDVDLGALVNELHAAHAEAIAINGQRIIATTAIHCVGPHIQVNGIRVLPPFRFSAIGKPAALYAAINTKGGNLEYLRAVGIRVRIAKQNNVLVPAARKLPHFHYGRPIK